MAYPHLGPNGRRPADVPPRPDALRPSHQREVRAEVHFDPNYLSNSLIAKVWYSPQIARWQVERAPQLVHPLVDGAALGEAPVGSPEWLTGEVFSHLGEAVVLEPRDLRLHIAARARELARELGVSRLRVATPR